MEILSRVQEFNCVPGHRNHLTGSHSITTIALYDGHEIKTYVQGQNLDDFIEAIPQYNVIVIYNGKSFDIPFIESYLNIRLNHAQIDLRYV
jgi:uncharacterized protein YprB with RNaseH-like and TPR domain